MFKKSVPTMASLVEKFTAEAKVIADEQTKKLEAAEEAMAKAANERREAQVELGKAAKFIKNFEAMLK